MLNESDVKKRKLTEFMNTNEYTKVEIQNCLNDEVNGNRKLSSELENLIERYGHTEANIINNITNYFMQRRSKLWMKLMSSADWFSVFLQYLKLKDIVNLDTAFCSYSFRPLWLQLINKHSLNVVFANNRLVDEVTDWLVMKNMHPKELIFKYTVEFDSHNVISDTTIFQLTKNSPNLKKLLIADNHPPYFVIQEKLFSYTAAFCTKLECLEIKHVDIPEDGIEILSISCHQLKNISFIDVCCRGIDKLIKVNPCLLSINIHLRPDEESIDAGDILEILGLHCQLLKIFLIDCATIQTVTDIQIETFTKGCPNLKEFSLVYLSGALTLKVCHKLLHCLRSHNAALEKLCLWKIDVDDEVSNDILTNEQSQSLQCLSNGCPLLKEIILGRCKLSTSDVSYLVNHSIHLEKLILSHFNMCDDGLIITKEADKLKYLKLLVLSYNSNITDASIINLVKGCHNLDYIGITGCSKLTDTSLFNIAANCPNLDDIFLDFDKVKITAVGLIQLLKKCPKLKNISSEIPIPTEIQNELNRRKQSMIST